MIRHIPIIINLLVISLFICLLLFPLRAVVALFANQLGFTSLCYINALLLILPIHFIFTFSLSFTIILGATILGFTFHNLRFFSLFVPSGCPLALFPLLVLIEFISYLARNVSLGLRLAANILSGHMPLNILSGFTYGILNSIIYIEYYKTGFIVSDFFLFFVVILNYFSLRIMYSNFVNRKEKRKFLDKLYSLICNISLLFKYIKENFFALLFKLFIIVIIGRLINSNYISLTGFNLKDPFLVHINKCLFMYSILNLISFYLFNFLSQKVKLEDALKSLTFTRFCAVICFYTILVYWGLGQWLLIYILPLLNEIFMYFIASIFAGFINGVQLHSLSKTFFKILETNSVSLTRKNNFRVTFFSDQKGDINFNYVFMIKRSNFIRNLLFNKADIYKFKVKSSCLSLISNSKNKFISTVNLKFYVSSVLSIEKIVNVITKNRLSLTNYIWENNPYKETMVLVKNGQIYIKQSIENTRYIFFSSDKHFIKTVNNLNYTDKISNFVSRNVLNKSFNCDLNKLLLNSNERSNYLDTFFLKEISKERNFFQRNLKDPNYIPELIGTNIYRSYPIVMMQHGDTSLPWNAPNESFRRYPRAAFASNQVTGIDVGTSQVTNIPNLGASSFNTSRSINSTNSMTREQNIVRTPLVEQDLLTSTSVYLNPRNPVINNLLTNWDEDAEIVTRGADARYTFALGQYIDQLKAQEDRENAEITYRLSLNEWGPIENSSTELSFLSETILNNAFERFIRGILLESGERSILIDLNERGVLGYVDNSALVRSVLEQEYSKRVNLQIRLKDRINAYFSDSNYIAKRKLELCYYKLLESPFTLLTMIIVNRTILEQVRNLLCDGLFTYKRNSLKNLSVIWKKINELDNDINWG